MPPRSPCVQHTSPELCLRDKAPTEPNSCPSRLHNDSCVMPTEGEAWAPDGIRNQIRREATCQAHKVPGQNPCTEGWVCTNVRNPPPYSDLLETLLSPSQFGGFSPKPRLEEYMGLGVLHQTSPSWHVNAPQRKRAAVVEAAQEPGGTGSRTAAGAHLAIAAVYSEGHAGGHEQEQRLLLRQLFLQPLDGLAALVCPLLGEATWSCSHSGGPGLPPPACLIPTAPRAFLSLHGL